MTSTSYLASIKPLTAIKIHQQPLISLAIYTSRFLTFDFWLLTYCFSRPWFICGRQVAPDVTRFLLSLVLVWRRSLGWSVVEAVTSRQRLAVRASAHKYSTNLSPAWNPPCSTCYEYKTTHCTMHIAQHTIEWIDNKSTNNQSIDNQS